MSFLQAYLTIDDSPSLATQDLLGFLKQRNIPALLFVRGDYMSEDQGMQNIVSAIRDGFYVGNHNYSHTRASEMDYEACIAEIAATEKLIVQAYQATGIERPAKYFRFPHMDRGCGGYVVDYDEYPLHKQNLLALFADGLNVSLQKPSGEDVRKKKKLQDYLRAEGFVSPFKNVTFPWYQKTEMADAIDAMFTFSNSDWMLTKRHLARSWPYKTVDDLRAKIDHDPWLSDHNSRHIILAHDQPEILDVTLATIRHMVDKGYEFLPPETGA